VRSGEIAAIGNDAPDLANALGIDFSLDDIGEAAPVRAGEPLRSLFASEESLDLAALDSSIVIL
jgi:hypothetical protein